jgi:hypothetical protein
MDNNPYRLPRAKVRARLQLAEGLLFSSGKVPKFPFIALGLGLLPSAGTISRETFFFGLHCRPYSTGCMPLASGRVSF